MPDVVKICNAGEILRGARSRQHGYPPGRIPGDLQPSGPGKPRYDMISGQRPPEHFGFIGLKVIYLLPSIHTLEDKLARGAVKTLASSSSRLN
jgi:hypothetical protein